MTSKFIWGTGLAIWLLFTFWYTNTGGPLTAAEVEHYLQLMAETDGVEADVEQIRGFLEGDKGGQFIMVNIVDLNENPPTIGGVEPGASADDLMARYMEFMFPAMLRRACHPAFYGPAIGPVVDLVGLPGAHEWDQAVLMRYRSVRDMLEIVTNPEFAGRHDYKIAALDKTVAFPVSPLLYYSDLRFVLGLLLLTLCALINLLISGKRNNPKNLSGINI
ncbi:hypothetical protein [Litorivivens sp.]|uniref:hypothetical protein n=2 Tax=Litorivivens sp. TaxID=2020868 RepID=UPI0035690477